MKPVPGFITLFKDGYSLKKSGMFSRLTLQIRIAKFDTKRANQNVQKLK